MKVNGRVMGVEDFDRAIEQLDSRQARNALRRATSQATQPVVKRARELFDRNVGRQTGVGRKSIKKRNLKKRERDQLGLDMATMVYIANDGFYGRFWEMGFTRRGQHFAARPFLRPAASSTQSEVIERFGARAGKIIEREAAKRGK